MTDRILLLLGITLMYSTPMVFAAQGSVISERPREVSSPKSPVSSISVLKA